MQGLGDFLFGDFLFWGFFLLFSSIRLSPFVHSPLPPHRIIIRQIRLSAASLHDMPSLACGASLDMVPAPSLANTPAYPSRLPISTACPLRKPTAPCKCCVLVLAVYIVLRQCEDPFLAIRGVFCARDFYERVKKSYPVSKKKTLFSCPCQKLFVHLQPQRFWA